MNEFWDELMARMNEAKEDTTIDAFLAQHFSDPKYSGLRDGVIRFAEGFDLADTHKASMLALMKEWENGFEEEQFRITGGYILLTEYLVDCCRKNNVEFYFSSEVKEVEWSNNRVIVSTGDSKFEGTKVLITVSIGILQAGKIRLMPEPRASRRSLPVISRTCVPDASRIRSATLVCGFDR